MGVYDVSQFKPSGSFKGDYYNYLSGVLKNGTMGMPNKKELQAFSNQNLNREFNSTLDSSKESLAANGLLGSGMEAVTKANLYSGKANAMAASDANLNNMDIQYRQNMIAQLLGLNQFGANMDFAETQATVQNAQFEKNLSETQRQFNWMKEKEDTNAWGEIIGRLLGTAVGSFGGGVGSAVGNYVGGQIGSSFDGGREAQISW